jgi:hypothetical protein
MLKANHSPFVGQKIDQKEAPSTLGQNLLPLRKVHSLELGLHKWGRIWIGVCHPDFKESLGDRDDECKVGRGMTNSVVDQFGSQQLGVIFKTRKLPTVQSLGHEMARGGT